MDEQLSQWIDEQRPRLEATLAERFADARPSGLQDALRYPLQTGGKRIRPLFGLASHFALTGGTDGDALMQACCAVELVHTYSLVHDDLPCMDDDDERRGKPTVHKVFGEGAAVLVGDALLTEAFAMVAPLEAIGAKLVTELAYHSGHAGMIGGQADDIGMAGPVRDIEHLMDLHARKTGALIRCAVRCGALVAGVEAAPLEALSRYGEAVGLAFQLADDVLDADEDTPKEGVPSFVSLMGVGETRRKAESLVEEALSLCGDLSHPGPLQGLARYSIERSH